MVCPKECIETFHDGHLSCTCPNAYLSSIFLTTARPCPKGCNRRLNNTCDCLSRQEAEANATRNLGLIILGAFLVALLLYTSLNVIARLRRCKRMRSDLDDDDDYDDGDGAVHSSHPGRSAIRQTYLTTSGPDQSEERSEVVHYTRMGSQTEHPIILEGNCIPPPYCEIEPKDMPPPYESLYLDSSSDNYTLSSNDVTSNNNSIDVVVYIDETQGITSQTCTCNSSNNNDDNNNRNNTSRN